MKAFLCATPISIYLSFSYNLRPSVHGLLSFSWISRLGVFPELVNVACPTVGRHHRLGIKLSEHLTSTFSPNLVDWLLHLFFQVALKVYYNSSIIVVIAGMLTSSPEYFVDWMSSFLSLYRLMFNLWRGPAISNHCESNYGTIDSANYAVRQNCGWLRSCPLVSVVTAIRTARWQIVHQWMTHPCKWWYVRC